jgi:RNA polymerase sigma-70 factor (ECF subfamily)
MMRYAPRLQRWASGRLPAKARGVFDTSDRVQETLMRTLQGLDRVEAHGPGGFRAYVRQAVLNRIRDQIRGAARRQETAEPADALVHPSPSPLEDAIGNELLERYDQGMASLDEDHRGLLHLRIELEFGFAEIAAMTGRPSPDAARMAFRRALAQLAEAMSRE